MWQHQLHVIRTDVLLHTLGGFAPSVMDTSEPRAYREKHRLLEPWQIRSIVELAKRPMRAKTGEVAAFAELSGITRDSVSVMIWNVRHGRAPRSWQQILEAA